MIQAIVGNIMEKTDSLLNQLMLDLGLGLPPSIISN